MFLQLYFYINVHIFPIIGGDIEASAIRRIGRQGEIKIEHQMHITHIILPRSRKNLVTDRLAQQIHLSSCRTEIKLKILRQPRLVAEGQKLPDQLLPYPLPSKEQCIHPCRGKPLFRDG